MSYKTPHVKTPNTAETVRLMIANGLSQEVVAKAMGISVDSLDRHYREEMDSAYAQTYGEIAANIVRQAKKDDFKAMDPAKYWMNTRGKWVPANNVQVTGKDGAPLGVGTDSESLRVALAALLGVSPETIQSLTASRDEGEVPGGPESVH